MILVQEPLQAWRDVNELHPLRDSVYVQEVAGHLALHYVNVPGPHGSHSYVLRVSPDEALTGAKTLTLEEAHSLANTQRTHLDALNTTGLHIPKYTSFIGESPVYEGPAVFNLVDRKDTVPVERRSLSTCKAIGKSLSQYLAWVQETEQPLVLDDIYKPRQFGVKPHVLGIEHDSRIWVLDIEPSFVDPQAVNEDGSTYLEDFWQRAVDLQRI